MPENYGVQLRTGRVNKGACKQKVSLLVRVERTQAPSRLSPDGAPGVLDSTPASVF